MWQFAKGFLPTRADYAGMPRTWRRDLLAGVTVAVVALPLALAFGVASGMGATAGLVTAVIAGRLPECLAAPTSRSPVQLARWPLSLCHWLPAMANPPR